MVNLEYFLFNTFKKLNLNAIIKLRLNGVRMKI